MRDQAEQLRRLTAQVETAGNTAPVPQLPPPLRLNTPPPPRRRTARFIAIASGKGGVGKSNLAVNLSYALLGQGHRVALVDGDISLPNDHILMGVAPMWHIGHLIRGDRSLEQVLHRAQGGLGLVSGGTGWEELADLSQRALEEFVDRLQGLQDHFDYVVLDAGAGVSQVVQSCLLACDRVVLVATPEPTSVADAYALLKTIWKADPRLPVDLVVNQADNREQARLTAVRLSKAAESFLAHRLNPLGYVPRDAAILRAVHRQVPLLLGEPHAPASRAIVELGQRLGQAASRQSLVEGFARRLGRWLGNNTRFDLDT